MANVASNKLREKLAASAATWDLRVLVLADSAYVPDPDVNFVTDLLLLTSEYAGTNYTRQTLTNVNTSRSDADDHVLLVADDVTWTALGATDGSDGPWGWAVVYAHNTTDADAEILAYHGLTGTPVGENPTLIWPSTGVCVLSTPSS